MSNLRHINPDDVIDLDDDALKVVDLDEERAKREKSILFALWISLSRRVRKWMRRGKKRIKRMWNWLPFSIRAALTFAAALTGWFMAWMMFLIAITIGFSYGLTVGVLTTFVCLFIVGLVITAASEAGARRVMAH